MAQEVKIVGWPFWGLGLLLMGWVWTPLMVVASRVKSIDERIERVEAAVVSSRVEHD